jgi:hypothetical protein
LAAAAIFAAAPAMAADRIVDVSSIENVAALMREAGYKAEIKVGKNGDSYIESGIGGNGFQVNFYGCKDKVGCDSLQFYSWYKKEPFFTVAMANEWNAGRRFLKVAIDSDGDLSEFLDVSCLGKMTFDNFKDYIDWYGSTDAYLIKFIAEKRDAATPGKK